MNLLHSIFPGLIELSGDGIPNWEDFEAPWSILAENERGLMSQISTMFEGDEEVCIHPSAKIGDCVRIEGPCFIGPNAEIRHGAFLRKGSWICEGSVVGHSTEVKNSVLLPGAKAPHFNYVGDSIIGFGSNLGAGVKISNVRNDQRGVLISMKNGEKIDSKLRKFGALVGDGSQLGCNAVTNPGSIIAPNSLISPNETISGWHGPKS